MYSKSESGRRALGERASPTSSEHLVRTAVFSIRRKRGLGGDQSRPAVQISPRMSPLPQPWPMLRSARRMPASLAPAASVMSRAAVTIHSAFLAVLARPFSAIIASNSCCRRRARDFSSCATNFSTAPTNSSRARRSLLTASSGCCRLSRRRNTSMLVEFLPGMTPMVHQWPVPW